MADITNAAAAGAAQAAETAENALAEAGSLPLDGTHASQSIIDVMFDYLSRSFAGGSLRGGFTPMSWRAFIPTVRTPTSRLQLRETIRFWKCSCCIFADSSFL